MAIFNFELEEMLESQIYSDDGRFGILWFYLASCSYHIDLGDVKLYELPEKYVKKYKLKSPYYNEFFIDVLEDIFVALETTAQPMPEEMFRHIDSEEKQKMLYKKISSKYDKLWRRAEKDMKLSGGSLEMKDGQIILSEKYLKMEEEYNILGDRFIWIGRISNPHIYKPVWLCFFHVEEKMHIRYNFLGKVKEEKNRLWTATKGEYVVGYDEFLNDFETALKKFFKDMGKRVLEAVEYFSENDYAVNQSEDYYSKFPDRRPSMTGAQQLLQEHETRRLDYFSRLEKIKSGITRKPTDWKEIEEKLKLI